MSMFRFWKKDHDVEGDCRKKQIKNFLEQAYAETYLTPDWVSLQQKQTSLLFVADELMPGHRFHPLVKEFSIFCGTAFTLDNYSMFTKKLGKGSYPVILPSQYITAPFTRVKGEVYAVRPYQILNLDRFRENGVQFVRQQIRVLVPHRRILREQYTDNGSLKSRLVTEPVRVSIQRVDAYIGRPEFWQDQLDGGYFFRPTHTFWPKATARPSIGRYYYYSRLEYDDQ